MCRRREGTRNTEMTQTGRSAGNYWTPAAGVLLGTTVGATVMVGRYWERH